MKNFLVVLFIAGMAAFTAGCHNDLDLGDLPFEEVLVIRGVLQDGDTLKTLYVARTTQFQEEYYQKNGRTVVNDFAGWISDAVVTVECDGKVYPMTYRGQGNFGNDALIIAAGKTYRLHASWNRHQAEAETTVPRPVSIDSVTVVGRTIIRDYGSWRHYNYTLEASVKNRMNSAFDMAVIQGVPSPYVAYVEGSDVVKIDRTVSPEQVKLQIKCNLSIRNMPGSLNKHTMIVQCFDEPYFYYRLSSKQQLSSQIAWNVTGDAIGIFIGSSKPVYKAFTLQS